MVLEPNLIRKEETSILLETNIDVTTDDISTKCIATKNKTSCTRVVGI
jgi:hypothetical protein